MSVPPFLRLLRTASSEVSKQTLFKNRFTHYIPDFFFIFFAATLFVSSGLLDLFFIFYLYLDSLKPIQASIYLATVVIPGVIEYYLNRTPAECMPNLVINQSFYFIISVVGFNAIYLFFKSCMEIFLSQTEPSIKSFTCFTYPIFHISDETLALIKIYCLVTSAVKTIPRLFILSIFLLHGALDKVAAYVAVTLIVVSVTIFSLTMAISFPIRPTPRVFTSTFCIPFNAFNKFMAAVCSCYVILAIFATLFKSVQYYALLVPVLRWLTWAWPCLTIVRSLKIPLSHCTFTVYFFFLTLFASIIYIHPFEGLGRLYYYAFYLLDFVEEIFLIYVLTDVSLDSVSGYFCFRVVMIGFLSVFGLTNILHKYKDEKIRYGCWSYSSGLSENVENIENVENVENVENEIEEEVEIEASKKKKWGVSCLPGK